MNWINLFQWQKVSIILFCEIENAIKKLFLKMHFPYSILVITTFNITVDLAFLTVYSTDKLYKATIPANGGTFAFTKVLDTGNQPRQVDYDPVEKKIYWIEWGAHMIGRCDLNGNNNQHHSVATSKYDEISYLIIVRLFLPS